MRTKGEEVLKNILLNGLFFVLFISIIIGIKEPFLLKKNTDLSIDHHREKIKARALATLTKEAESILNLVSYINDPLNNAFFEAVELIYDCQARVVVTGMGKSAIIAQKIVATFNSTGTSAMFLHAADAIHGDIGMVQQKDVVLILSNSGETPEIRALLPLLKSRGNTLIAVVGNQHSLLAQAAHCVLENPVEEEAGPHKLAPSSSTAAQMALGDALAFCVLELRGFSTADFARLHPGGMLGKKLYMTVEDLYKKNERPMVQATDHVQKVIIEMTGKRLGATAVVNETEELLGIITDGDLRRMLESHPDANPLQMIKVMEASQIMTKGSKTIEKTALAVEALEELKKHNITQIIVVEGKKYLGMVHLHDLLKEGLI